MDYRSHIINHLLDKYENSAHFYGSAQINRHVAINFTRKTMPAYFAGDHPQNKSSAHQAVSELQAVGILTVEWLAGEKGNLLKRIILNLNKLDAAYLLIGRMPKADQLTFSAQMLTTTLVNVSTPWIRDLLSEMGRTIETTRTFPSPIPTEEEILGLLLKTLLGLDKKGDEEVSERIFSIRYLGNSKLFSGKLRSVLISLVRSHRFRDLEFSDEDILAELGIVKTSAELLLAGPLILEIEGLTADLSPLAFGAVIDSHRAACAKIISINADKIILVENKTNFHELVRQNVNKHLIIVYIGGFPGPVKRRFLASLGACAQASGVSVHHWGDIDFGGFRIYRVLKETAFPHLIPMLMNETTLLKYRHMADPLKPAYKNKLVKMGTDSRYTEFHDVIVKMLTHNIRLEQEAILAESTFILPANGVE